MRVLLLERSSNIKSQLVEISKQISVTVLHRRDRILSGRLGGVSVTRGEGLGEITPGVLSSYYSLEDQSKCFIIIKNNE